MTITSYVQLPPDGVGKKVRHRVIWDIKVTPGATTPSVGQTLHGGTSGVTGILTGIYSAEDTVFYLREVSGTFTTGETLLDPSNNACGTILVINTSNYTPGLNIVDADVPEYTLTVDKRGAALTSFPEGTPQFDGWGHMQMSQMLAVGEYYHFVQDYAGKYYTVGSVVHNPMTSSMLYTTGTSSGDVARRTTAQYHPYKPGVSQLIYISASIGTDGVNGSNIDATHPAGKTNVVREWGYFDDYNGFGFRLDGTTLKVFLRSDSSDVITDAVHQKFSGTGPNVIDTEYSQSEWNVNTLNSSTSSDFLLNVTKSNLYWMDVQGTVGRIRLGVETPDGRRITCHEFRPINDFTGPSCRNLSLPVTWAQRNTGAVSSSPATTQTMRIGAAVVFTETADVKYSGVLTHIIPDDPITLTDSTVYKPFLQFKAKNTVAGPSQTAGTFVANLSYTIESIGSTNFMSIGASANIPGVKFTANAAGVGSGTAHVNLPNSIIGIHETFDWAIQGNTNAHVGIFVYPNEKWLNNMNWSETIDSQTMLYVDQSATEAAQYRYWDTSATGISGGISGTTMTISSISFGAVLKEMYITPSPTYASGPLYINGNPYFVANTGGIAARTKVLTQLTGSGTATATASYGTQAGGSGVAGSNKLVVSTLVGIAQDQLISGANLPAGTFVEGIDTATSTLTLSKAFYGTGSSTYSFYTPGGAGTYTVSQSQSVGSFTGYGGYYAFHPIESFIAPANGAGRAALGDRIEKSFGLGPVAAAEDAKGVFSFMAKPLTPGVTCSLMYTKYWKEIR